MSTPELKPLPCRCLRTKNPYGTTPENVDTWITGIHSSSSYWCMRTVGPAGPDENYVHLARCVPGRRCYESPEE